LTSDVVDVVELPVAGAVDGASSLPRLCCVPVGVDPLDELDPCRDAAAGPLVPFDVPESSPLSCVGVAIAVGFDVPLVVLPGPRFGDAVGGVDASLPLTSAALRTVTEGSPTCFATS
jgi:hypothetical protein